MLCGFAELLDRYLLNVKQIFIRYEIESAKNFTFILEKKMNMILILWYMMQYWRYFYWKNKPHFSSRFVNYWFSRQPPPPKKTKKQQQQQNNNKDNFFKSVKFLIYKSFKCQLRMIVTQNVYTKRSIPNYIYSNL